jgi:methyl-accepting chemotaxis protein
MKLQSLLKIFNGMRARLIALLMLFGVLPLTISYLNFQSHRPDLINMSTQIYALKAKSTGDIIDRNLFERYGDVQAFAANALVEKINFTDPALNERSGIRQELVATMNTYVRLYGIYPVMMLLNRNGQVLAINSSDANAKPVDTSFVQGLNFADAPWFQKALSGDFLTKDSNGQGSVILDPRREGVVARVTKSDGFSMAFAAQVRNAQQEVQGVWVNFIDFSTIEDIVTEQYQSLKENNQPNAEITVLDRQGRVLIDYDPATRGLPYKRDFTVLQNLNLAQKGVTAAQEAVAGKSGALVSLHARKKVEQAAGYAATKGIYSYPGLGWSVLVRVPVQEAFVEINSLNFETLVMIALCAVLVLVVGSFVGVWFTKPINTLNNTMRTLAQGTVVAEIPYLNHRGEAGRIARTVQVFKENTERKQVLEREQQRVQAEREAEREAQAALKIAQAEQEAKRDQERQRQAEQERKAMREELAHNFEQSVQHIVTQLSTAVVNLKATSQTLTTTASSTSAQVTQVTQSVRMAGENVNTVAAAAEELSASVAEISNQISATAREVEDASQLAIASRNQVNGLVDAATRIGEVINLINDIASRTNLLALNATIEAARAGEAGRGFAVVATEVKSLAQQTADAAQDIIKQVTAIQDETGLAVEAISRINDRVEAISQQSSAVSAALNEQSTATTEIARSSVLAASGTQQIDDSMGYVTQAAQSTYQDAHTVDHAAGQVETYTHKLKHDIELFIAKLRAA